jgi:iron-sulfur cluster repair protein YtfE (RIC family)
MNKGGTMNVADQSAPHEGVDFTLMYAIHDAFRRDLDRLVATSSQASRPEVLRLWAIFSEQLHLHHTGEDEVIWPKLYAVATSPVEVAIVDALVAEHAAIVPLVGQVGACYSSKDGRGLAANLSQLSELLAAHMAHEEHDGLPLIERLLGQQGWDAFIRHMAEAQGPKDAAVFFPWLLEGAPQERVDQMLRMVPPAVRVLYQGVWLPQYTRTHPSPAAS